MTRYIVKVSLLAVIVWATIMTGIVCGAIWAIDAVLDAVSGC